MKAKWVPAVSILPAVLMLTSCGGQTIGGSFPKSFPTHQEVPAVSQTGLIAYLDNGVVCVNQNGLYRVEPSLAGIWVLDSLGHRSRILASGDTPDWMPGGARLALSADGQICTCSADGNGFVVLTSDGVNRFPSWSPDGSSIAYESTVGGIDGGYSVWTMAADGSNKKLLATKCRMPDWSPDGSGIIVVGTDSTAGSGLLHIRLSDHRVTNLYPSGLAEQPRYSPTGQFVAFAQIGHGIEVWIMRSDGTRAHAVTFDGGADPAWYPADSAICFVRENTSSPASAYGVLWRLNLGSGTLRQLTSHWSGPCP